MPNFICFLFYPKSYIIPASIASVHISIASFSESPSLNLASKIEMAFKLPDPSEVKGSQLALKDY